MLGNKDFAQMVSSGAVGGGKVKFDLKQVSKWDRENQKASQKKKQPEVEFREKEKKDDWKSLGYRDRAEERRKGFNIEDEKKDDIVSKLDTEKTHMLGGDLEHTHMVRGLDRALLQKVREDLELQKAVSTEEEAKPVAPQPKALYQTININAGARIPGINVALPPAAGKEVVELTSTKKVAEEYAVSKKKRKERDVDNVVESVPLPSNSPPAAKKPAPSDFSIYDDVVEKYVPVGAIDETTGEVLKPAAASESSSSSSGRVGSSIFSTKSSFSSSGATTSMPPPPPPSVPFSSFASSGSGVQKNSVVSSMLDGIYDTSKVGACNSWSTSTISTASKNNNSSSSNSSGISNEGYSAFAKPPPPTVKNDDVSGALTSEDLMKPVMALLHAQANKEKAAQERLQKAASGSSSSGGGSSSALARNNKIVIETDEQGRQLVHRDVFATTLDKVVKATTIVGLNGKEGEMFGLHGSYEDVYPESAEYEVLSGDEDEADASTAKKPVKSSRDADGGDRGGGSLRAGSTAFSATVGLEGSIKKNIVKNSVTPWSRGHGMSGGGASAGSKTPARPMHSGATAAGLNRAARRAAGL